MTDYDSMVERFSRRLPAELDMAGLMPYFFENLELFSEDFRGFFPDLLEHAKGG